MKLSLGKRIVFFLHWLLSLGLLIYTALSTFGIVPKNIFERFFGMAYAPIVFISFVVFHLLMSVLVVCFLLKSGSKRTERGFIMVDSSENGKVRIAVSAIEQMIRQAVYDVDGVTDMKIFISGEDDALSIKVNVVMLNGSHVPTVTMNMQHAIRQFIEVNCGVAVHSISINIQSVVNADDVGNKNRKSDRMPFVATQSVIDETSVAETVHESESVFVPESDVEVRPEVMGNTEVREEFVFTESSDEMKAETVSVGTVDASGLAEDEIDTKEEIVEVKTENEANNLAEENL